MKSSTQTAGAGPLAGIRVVEIGTLIAAPFASRLMADFGAEVIKIEPKGGDPLRKWRRLHKGVSLWWYVQSRNKQSITLDLKSPGGREIALRLIKEADVLIENYRPGAMEKLGMGWDELSKLNPKLVMVRISGYGQTGPYRDRPGFGAIGEAMGGLRYTTGEPEGPPVRVGVSIGDSLASLHAVMGALMCLLRVKMGKGLGQVVDVSLFESVFSIMESVVPEYDVYGDVRERSGGKLPGICPSNTYKTRDNAWIVIAANGDAIYRRLMAAMGRQDLAGDPALQSNDGRVAQEPMIDGAIAAWAAGQDLADALEILQRAEVPVGKIYSVADMAQDPQYLARDMLVSTTLPDGTSMKMPGITPKLSETPGAINWIGPTPGEHAHELLTRFGFQPSEIEAFQKSGAI